jgi:hypothetical protein
VLGADVKSVVDGLEEKYHVEEEEGEDRWGAEEERTVDGARHGLILENHNGFISSQMSLL